MWDGWMRLNFDTKSGGVIGVFRQGAADEHRTVVVKDLDPAKTYSVKFAPEGKELLRATGKALMDKGFEVTLANKYDGNIYEVTVVE
jgi:alpha-galactosidase